MQFITLVKKRNNFYLKVIALPIALLLLFLVIFLWPKKTILPIKYYLPVNTGFYLHLKESNWLPSSQDNSSFISNEAFVTLWQKQKELLGPYYNNLEELVWFKTEGNFSDDSFLLRFSTLPDRDYLDSLKKSFPDRNFYKLDKNTLLFSSFLPEDITYQQKELPVEDLYFQSEAIIYLQSGMTPEFLVALSGFIEPLMGEEGIFIGLDKSNKQINFLSASQSKTNGNEADFSGLLLPESVDLGFAFSSELLLEHKKIISNLLINNFSSLPLNTLGLDYREGLLLEKKAIFQQGDNWLALSQTPWGEELWQFLNIFKVKEVYKILPDGTGYYELMADKDQLNKEYELAGIKYYQMGNLYTLERDSYYYLSNSEEFIKNIISQPKKISDLLSCGNMDNKKIEDFVLINSDKLSDKLSRDYLVAKNITSFKAFSYKADDFSGLRLCY